MTLTTYPLNDVDYSAEDAELFHCTRSSGIYVDDDFAPSVTGADCSVTIGPGIGWIQNSKFSGKVVANKTATTLDLGLSDAVYPRIDVVAIQFSAVNNKTELVVKQGTPATVPTIPARVQTESVYELYLCYVTRAAGSAVISASDVADVRLSPTYCGLMADAAIRVNTEAFDNLTGLLKLKRVWTNLDTVSSFAAQTITLSAAEEIKGNYFWIVEFKLGTSLDAAKFSEVVFRTDGFRAMRTGYTSSGAASKVHQRQVNFDASTGCVWDFEDCRTNGEVNNAALIPLNIYVVYQNVVEAIA